MGDEEEERKALEAAGLDAPEDLSGLTEDQLLERIQQKAEEARRFDEQAAQQRLRELGNIEVPAVSKEDLLARMATDEGKSERLKQRSEAQAELYKSKRAERWASKVPPMWEDAKLENLDPKDLQIALDWLAQEHRTNLIVTGPTGVGKTFLAYAIARELYLEGSKVMIRDAAVLIDEMRVGSSVKEQTFKWAREAPNFVVDDLGVERSTEFADERLHLIFDHRWQWKLPTILTTNIKIEDLYDKLGGRLASRLAHDATFYRMKGQDRRI